MCLSYKPYFFTISFDHWGQNLQWQLGLVWLWHQKHVCGVGFCSVLNAFTVFSVD
jgi:hypothetical protein